MSEEISIPVNLPLDKDGFLRRECPDCERQFKWWNAPNSGDHLQERAEKPEAYFCPYCYEPASLDSWWTKEQIGYVRQVAAAEALEPQLRSMKKNLERGNRRSRWLNIEVLGPDLSPPEPLSEPDDMARIDVPCHPEEPLKVDEAWNHDVACSVCGVRYPVEIVRALPDNDGDNR